MAFDNVRYAYYEYFRGAADNENVSRYNVGRKPLTYESNFN